MGEPRHAGDAALYGQRTCARRVAEETSGVLSYGDTTDRYVRGIHLDEGGRVREGETQGELLEG